MSRQQRQRRTESEQIDSGAVPPVRRDRYGPAPEGTNDEPFLTTDLDESAVSPSESPGDETLRDVETAPGEFGEAVRWDEGRGLDHW